MVTKLFSYFFLANRHNVDYKTFTRIASNTSPGAMSIFVSIISPHSVSVSTSRAFDLLCWSSTIEPFSDLCFTSHDTYICIGIEFSFDYFTAEHLSIFVRENVLITFNFPTISVVSTRGRRASMSSLSQSVSL